MNGVISWPIAMCVVLANSGLLQMHTINAPKLSMDISSLYLQSCLAWTVECVLQLPDYGACRNHPKWLSWTPAP